MTGPAGAGALQGGFPVWDSDSIGFRPRRATSSLRTPAGWWAGFVALHNPSAPPADHTAATLSQHRLPCSMPWGCTRAGSVDERADQQGLAHLVEHVTFLGSFRREQLLGTGARSNAYTDFHHTVFHVHAPLANTASPQATPMLPQARPTSGILGISPNPYPKPRPCCRRRALS